MIFALTITIVETIMFIGTKIANSEWNLRRVLIPQEIIMILEIVILGIRKEVVLEVLSPLVSETKEGIRPREGNLLSPIPVAGCRIWCLCWWRKEFLMQQGESLEKESC